MKGRRPWFSGELRLRVLDAAAGEQGTTVVLSAPTVVLGGGTATFGYQPARTKCPHCHADIVTNIDHEVGKMAWMICGLMVLVSGFIP